jgi:MFS family permease
MRIQGIKQKESGAFGRGFWRNGNVTNIALTVGQSTLRFTQEVKRMTKAAKKFEEWDEAEVSALHWKIMLISGMGFFTDAYDLFIIGVIMAILKPIWHVTALEASLVSSTALLASALGALAFGRVADMWGRKRIYGVEVLVLAAGAIGCALAPNIGWLIALRFILGIGIGGDYPVSATIMSEYAGRRNRGMLVTLVFSMQAAGLILGPLLAAALLATPLSHDLIWRILFAVGAIPALAVYWQRRRLRETPRYLAASGQQEDEHGRLSNSDGHREDRLSFGRGFAFILNDRRLFGYMLGASAAWFLMDAAYYGNTVSSPLVLSALGHDQTLLHKTLTELGIFVLFAAPGYAVAARMMDRLGRKTIQCMGFLLMAVTFLLMAIIPNLQSMVVPFLLIYGLSYFFTEFGPNATTFVYPSEIFPVQVRTTGHGIAAAAGKLGGFIGVFLFPYLMHWKGLAGAEAAAAAVSVLGFAVTWILLPETKGKTLEEISEVAAMENALAPQALSS